VQSQNDLNILLKDGFNEKHQPKTRIKSLHAAAELMTDSNPDSSYILLDSARALISTNKNTAFLQANHLIRAKTLLIQGVYLKALDFAQQSLVLSEKLNNKRFISDCFSVIGEIYERQENNTKAAAYHKKALKLNRALGDSLRISSSLSLLGNIYGATKQYNSALYSYRESLNFIDIDKNPSRAAIAYGNIGYVQYEQGVAALKAKHPNATNYFNLALEASQKAKVIFQSLNNKRFQIIAELNIGLVYHELKNYNTALTWCYSAYKTAKDLKIPPLEKDACDCLYKSNKALGNNAEALNYFEIYKTLNDSIGNLDNERAMVEKELNFNYEKEQLADSLKYAQKEIVTASRIQKQQVGLISAGGILLLIIVLMIVVVRGKRRSDELLLNILPYETAQELKQKGQAETKNFDSVTVLFTDFKGFTTISEMLTPKELITEIDTCFKGIDRIMDKYGIEKIKTIGDAYMAAGGLPKENVSHPMDVVMAAEEILTFMDKLKQERIRKNSPYFEIRIGIHTGPVIAGIVGIKKFSYDIWGDTVNTASRMESSGEINRINLSGATHELIKDHYACEYRGKVEAKNKGKIDMYFLEKRIS
jgi:class 3 adenylate cyclase/Tfp pilus assembly protein PilF